MVSKRGGRAGRPLDPGDGPLAAFAFDLVALRHAAGLTVQEVARRGFISKGAVSMTTKGVALPTLAMTLAYVRACGGDEESWTARWTELASGRDSFVPDAAPAVAAIDSVPTPAPASNAEFVVPRGPAARRSRLASLADSCRRLNLRWTAAVVVLAVLAVAATVMVLTQEEDPAPDATRPAANSATVTAFLGGPDYVGFCRATGQGVAEVSGPTAYDRGCTQPHGSGVSAAEVCAWTYHTDRLVDRIADFNDPSSIECWSVSAELGPLDFDEYCRRTGYTGAVAVNATAYAWYCDGKRAIDSQAACALVYRATPAVSRFSDFHNRDSWTCHA